MSIESAAHQFFTEVRDALDAEAHVAFDALMQAGWPSTRIAQTVERVPSDLGAGVRVTLKLTHGIELLADLPVFVAEWRFVDGGRGVQIDGTWLVSPIPQPHRSTIARANPPPRPTWCERCEREISNDTCWCGEDIDHRYGPSDGHVPVPMGCVCSRAD